MIDHPTRFAISTAAKPQHVAPQGVAVLLPPVHAPAPEPEPEPIHEQQAQAQARAERRKKARAPKQAAQRKRRKRTHEDDQAEIWLRMARGDAAAAAEWQRLPASSRELVAAAAGELDAMTALDTITPAALASRMRTIRRRSCADNRAGRGAHVPLDAARDAAHVAAEPNDTPEPAPEPAALPKHELEAWEAKFVWRRGLMVDQIAATEGGAGAEMLDAFKLQLLRLRAERDGRPFGKLTDTERVAFMRTAAALYVGDLAAVPPRKRGRKPAQQDTRPAQTGAWQRHDAAEALVGALCRRCGLGGLTNVLKRVAYAADTDAISAFDAELSRDPGQAGLLAATTAEALAAAAALPLPPKPKPEPGPKRAA